MTQALLIIWKDAEGQGAGWHSGEEIAQWAECDDTALCASIGFLVDETEEYFTLAGSIVGSGWGEVQKIPKGMIQIQKVLKTWPKKP